MLKLKQKCASMYGKLTMICFIMISLIFITASKGETVHAEAQIPNKTYYVSIKGADINDGTIEKPFYTIQRGINEMKPGDTLIIREGVYHEAVQIYKKNGSNDSWCTIKSYPGENVNVTGEYKLNINDMADPSAFTFRESSYWKLDGIKINQYVGSGIYITGKSSYIDMNDLNIGDIDYPVYRPYGTSGIDGEDSSYCTVKNCEIYNVGLKVDKPKDHGIYIGYGASNWKFEGNNIHDNAGAAIQMYGKPNGGSNCTLINNKLYNNHAFGLAIGSNAANNSISNNLFYGNRGCDIYLLENSNNNWFKENLFLTAYSNYNIELAGEQSFNNSFNYNTYYKADASVTSRYYEANKYNEALSYDQWKASGQEDSGKFISEPDEAQEAVKKWEPITAKQYTSKRLTGSDRFSTAVSIAEEFNNEKISDVTITSGYDFTNALSGSVLAKKLNAPILLSGKTDLENKPAIQYIQKHMDKSGNIYILGNKMNSNENIIINLKKLGYNNIKTLNDGEKFGATKAINDTINASQGTPIIITSGNEFADGLGASTVAALNGYPVILSDVYEIPLESQETLKKVKPSKVYIIGGDTIISNNVKDKVKKLCGISDDKIVRIWGEDRYTTSINIAKYFQMDGSNITLSSGEDFPDALAGSVLAAKLNSPLILLGDNNNEQKKFIDLGKYTNQIILGGTSSISDNVKKDLAR